MIYRLRNRYPKKLFRLAFVVKYFPLPKYLLGNDESKLKFFKTLIKKSIVFCKKPFNAPIAGRNY